MTHTVSHHLLRRTARAKCHRLEQTALAFHRYRVVKVKRGPWRYRVVEIVTAPGPLGPTPD